MRSCHTEAHDQEYGSGKPPCNSPQGYAQLCFLNLVFWRHSCDLQTFSVCLSHKARGGLCFSRCDTEVIYTTKVKFQLRTWSRSVAWAKVKSNKTIQVKVAEKIKWADRLKGTWSSLVIHHSSTGIIHSGVTSLTQQKVTKDWQLSTLLAITRREVKHLFEEYNQTYKTFKSATYYCHHTS